MPGSSELIQEEIWKYWSLMNVVGDSETAVRDFSPIFQEGLRSKLMIPQCEGLNYLLHVGMVFFGRCCLFLFCRAGREAVISSQPTSSGSGMI